MPSNMITYEEAVNTLSGRVRFLGTESVRLDAAMNRILARDVVCDMDLPPFNKSAMDGYACRREDLPGPLSVIETVQAGMPTLKNIKFGECTKIMTGAEVPEGADCVMPVEHTESTAQGLVRFIGTTLEANICYKGEDIKQGDVVLKKGSRLSSRHIAVLASTGCVYPEVARRPKVGLIATGNELVEPETTPGVAQIRNSNSSQLKAQLEQVCADVTYYGIIPDEESLLDAAMKNAMAENDVIVFSGGVSMGDYDFVPEIMRRNGFEILFDAIAMKPGKPTTFGVGSSTYCFGLPGNPVSSFLQCETLVKPFLFALMGYKYPYPWISWPLAETYTRRNNERESWIPVRRTENETVLPLSYHGSAHINALTDAFGFMIVPRSVARIEKDSPVRVWVL